MITDKSIKEAENSSVLLTVTIPADSIETGYKAKLAKYAKEVQLKGFRKGKAPVSLLESKFGQAVREESTFDTLEEGLKEALDAVEDKYRPLPYSTPVLQDEEELIKTFVANQDVTFTVKYDVLPQFELPAYTGLSLTYPKVEITDADVDKEIDRLKDQNATIIKKNGAVAEGDIVTLDYTQVDENGEKIADGDSREDYKITVGTSYNYFAFDKDIIGMNEGEEKIIKKKYTKKDESVNEALRGTTVFVKVNIKDVKIKEIPALDDDFAQDISEEYKTVDDLLKGTREKLQKALDARLEDDKTNAVTEALLKNVKMDVPQSMVELEMEQNFRRIARQSGLDEETFEKFLSYQGQSKESLKEQWREGAADSIKVQLVLDKIKDTENFDVTDEEIVEAGGEQYAKLSDEQKEQAKEMIIDDVRYSKVIPFLKEKNTFTEGEAVEYQKYIAGIQG